MTVKQPRELSHEDKLYAFRRATNGFSQSEGRWKERAERGLTDEELKAALEYELGIYGGSGGPGDMSLTFQAAATIRMAREVYGIKDPTDTQMALF